MSENTFELRIELPDKIEKEVKENLDFITIVIGAKKYRIKQNAVFSYYRKFEIKDDKNV